jgi:histidine kinase/DNA gyrase B/HSP90-like ATPase
MGSNGLFRGNADPCVADPEANRLLLSRRFCQTMGGDITVDSVPGQGSTFTIRLPVDGGVPKAPATIGYVLRLRPARLLYQEPGA